MTNTSDSISPVVKHRKNYSASDYLIKRTQLNFDLHNDHVIVNSQLIMARNPHYINQEIVDLVLDGIGLKLLSIKIDDIQLADDDFIITEKDLTIKALRLRHLNENSFVLDIQVKIYPTLNTSLEGLYMSNGKFCTQCEAEGFRNITYYLDKPEIMSEFFVSIEANKNTYPLLLSNGNPISQQDLTNGRHIASWHDPFPKPSYLFALVAGDLDCLEDKFKTLSGKDVTLRLFVDKGKIDQCRFAMDSLIGSMKWDEENFGREYDLELYMIVAVSDFNMGAMENKGLNIFNTAFVLAHESTATDTDFEGVERVIAHEYFHNWTGNRVTCRDWFQLSLKEGLTVFRDQLFSETMQSEAVERINQVKIIRSAQFAEDSGPMAHPIRPDSYIEMNNFYTVTVYNKGAEVIRMMHTILGKNAFRKGMDYYFDTFDGQAVTCEDFVRSMEKANNVDWSNFRNWYSQAGTPTLRAQISNSEPSEHCITLKFVQSCKQSTKASKHDPFMIPIKIGLISSNGRPLTIKSPKDSQWNTDLLLIMTEKEQTFDIQINTKDKEDITRCIPSLLRGFSAPVKLIYNYSSEELATLFSHDTDSFNRWDAGQTLVNRILLSNEEEISTRELNIISDAFHRALIDNSLDNALKALAVTLPNLNGLIGEANEVNLDILFSKHKQLEKYIADELEHTWLNSYVENSQLPNETAGDRSLKNRALSYLLLANEEQHVDLAIKQRQESINMTDELAALQAICKIKKSENLKLKNEQIRQFYIKWQDEDLVMDKWFSAQVLTDSDSVFVELNKLLAHEKFSLTNPNKVRSVIASFAGDNVFKFHCSTGSGYDFITKQIIKLNEINPQMGARLAKQFSQWRKFDKKRQALIKDCLNQIMLVNNLSDDIYEVVSKSLEPSVINE